MVNVIANSVLFLTLSSIILTTVFFIKDKNMTHAEAHETGSDTLSDETSTSTWIPIPATASNSTNIPELELSMVSTSKLTKTQTKASSTTFGVANKTAEPYSHFPYLHMTPAEQIKALPQFQKNNCTQILQMSKFPEKVHISNKGFVATVVDAYVSHHNLVIRPDDIWAAIMIQFSFYINKHAEEFRTQFVDFEGKKKKKLEISMPGSLESARYDTFVKLMSQEIDKNLVDPTVKNWVLPDFSTTTDNDLVTVGVVFMASMKKYFKYKVFFECGIPEITLEGTVEDWRNVYGRLEKLKEYKLEKWYNLLEPVIKQFVNAKEGNVDSRFWDQIVNYDPGCGWPSISGWITVFSSFYENGMWRGGDYNFVSVSDIPAGVVEVDVDINDNCAEYKSLMVAGHVGAEIKGEDTTIQPTLGWAIALKP